MRITNTEIFFMNFLAEKTGIVAKDCIVQDNILAFLIQKEQMGKAIGSKGATAKSLSDSLNKKTEFLSYNEDLKSFVEENLGEAKVIDVAVQDRKARIRIAKASNIDLSKNKKKILLLKEFIKRTNNLNEVRIMK